MLNMSVENIRKLMGSEIELQHWSHPRTTNCYAFALGLDVSEDAICKKAYIPGHIAENIIGTDTYDITTSEQLEKYVCNDLMALGLRYEEVDVLNRVPRLKIYNEECETWDILLFMEPSTAYWRDFHFAKVGSDGKLYHKQGWGRKPQKTSITDISEYGYHFVKRYRLSLDRKRDIK